ncbi:MAG: hypothetical protein K6F12_05235 [Streptococcus sp.]|uniref:hypothetical protein n=1 Tax=Streptococcus sp. TaxID=1306 RepID=UPI00258DB483|nr:hypothetical protein [Streptococcus sp.]MCR5493052.1 hypothetical protein [Streptococcus sp.]
MTYEMIIHLSDGSEFGAPGVTERQKIRLNYEFGKCIKKGRPWVGKNGVIINPQNILYIEFNRED